MLIEDVIKHQCCVVCASKKKHEEEREIERVKRKQRNVQFECGTINSGRDIEQRGTADSRNHSVDGRGELVNFGAQTLELHDFLYPCMRKGKKKERQRDSDKKNEPDDIDPCNH